MLKHWPILLLLLAGFLLRIQFLHQGAITFFYDQARDAYVIDELLHGDVKIQGPPTSTLEFFHGVLYYYVLAPGYWLGHGSPIVAATWLAGLLSLVIPLTYVISLYIYKQRFYAGLAALLVTFSYESTQYSFYLSNTSLAVLTVPLLYFFLFYWHRRFRFAPFLTGIALGLTFQANFLLIYHLVCIIILVLFRKLIISKRHFLYFLVGFFGASSTMWLSEIKFGFPSLHGPAKLLAHSDYTVLHVNLSTILSSAIYQFTRLISLNLFPTWPQIATIVFLLLLIVYTFYRRPSWWFLVCIPLLVFPTTLLVGGISTPYIHAGLGILAIILSVYFLTFIPRKFNSVSALITIPLVISNLYFINTNNSKGSIEFAIQKTMTLKNEIQTLDYVYNQAENRPFSINTITSPLYVNTTWSYLLNWYGQSKYGYLPYWHGRNQIGSLGNNFQSPPPGIKNYFVIIEPPQGLPVDIKNQILDQENGVSSFNHFTQFGEITVQNRTGKK